MKNGIIFLVVFALVVIIGYFCVRVVKNIQSQKIIDELYARIAKEGIGFLYSPFFTTCKRFLDLPRRQELRMLINRMRKIHMVKGTTDEASPLPG